MSLPRDSTPPAVVSGRETSARVGPKQGPSRVRCPRCGEPATWKGNPWRPFCSKRCKTGDLAAWASGEYAIPTQDSTQDNEDNSEQEAKGDS